MEKTIAEKEILFLSKLQQHSLVALAALHNIWQFLNSNQLHLLCAASWYYIMEVLFNLVLRMQGEEMGR